MTRIQINLVLLLALALAAIAANAEANSETVTVVVVGATGNLAAKYLWVALFRLALRDQSRSYRFLAGTSDPIERGNAWKARFFSADFERRVCGDGGSDVDTGVGMRAECIAFFQHHFKPSVRYAPLRSDAQYEAAAAMLNEDAGDTIEAGRVVYLAIPPEYFLQTITLVDRHLRLQHQSVESKDTSFLRVVIEKPFGSSFESARELASSLSTVLSDNEIFVMDHYAGKPAVRALQSYLSRNHAALHPLWSSRHISGIQVEMTERETLQGRINYFHHTGIIRDVMVNHLHLLLGLAIDPSFKLDHNSIANRLSFVDSLNWDRDGIHTWQYAEYPAQVRLEMTNDDKSVFTPTAAAVSFSSSLPAWNATEFILTAAKAAATRLLEIRVDFDNAPLASPCSLTITIQRGINADAATSQSITWSCDLISPADHVPPHGWTFADESKRTIVPTATAEQWVWDLGTDQASAYDLLLLDVAHGIRDNFADIREVLAAWKLWTPIVEAAEVRPNTFEYPTGVTPWELDAADRAQAFDEL